MAIADTTNASYDVVIHQNALSELHSLPTNIRQEFREIAHQAAKLKKPSNHPNIRLLRHSNNMMRIRVDYYRAICDLSIPEFRVLLIDHREYVYQSIEEAKARQSDD